MFISKKTYLGELDRQFELGKRVALPNYKLLLNSVYGKYADRAADVHELALVMNEFHDLKSKNLVLAEQFEDARRLNKNQFATMVDRGKSIRELSVRLAKLKAENDRLVKSLTSSDIPESISGIHVGSSRLRAEYNLINALKQEKHSTAYCVMKTTTTKQVGGFENLVTTIAITSDESFEECSRIMREKIKQCVNGGCTIHTYNIDVF